MKTLGAFFPSLSEILKVVVSATTGVTAKRLPTNTARTTRNTFFIPVTP